MRRDYLVLLSEEKRERKGRNSPSRSQTKRDGGRVINFHSLSTHPRSGDGRCVYVVAAPEILCTRSLGGSPDYNHNAVVDVR